MFMESLTIGPELENSQDPFETLAVHCANGFQPLSKCLFTGYNAVS
jgi:hypothetical protein